MSLDYEKKDPEALSIFDMMKNKDKRTAELEKEVAELKDQNRNFPRVCHWSQDDDGCWSGSCGIAWYIPEGMPMENTMNYCPNCGATLLQK